MFCHQKLLLTVYTQYHHGASPIHQRWHWEKKKTGPTRTRTTDKNDTKYKASWSWDTLQVVMKCNQSSCLSSCASAHIQKEEERVVIHKRAVSVELNRLHRTYISESYLSAFGEITAVWRYIEFQCQVQAFTIRHGEAEADHVSSCAVISRPQTPWLISSVPSQPFHNPISRAVLS